MYIFFDMDGTIADLYSVDGWLESLRANDTKPYAEAKVMLNMSALARMLNKAQRNGHKVGIISWTSKNGSAEYNEAVAAVKKAWLAKHLASVKFDSINIVEYGYSKDNFRTSADDILFDDEAQNRTAWQDKAHNSENILEVLKAI